MDNRTLREKLKDIAGPGMSDIKRAGAWLEILTVHVAAQDARLTRVEAATIGTQQPPPAPRTDVDACTPPAPRTDVDAEELRLLRLVADAADAWCLNTDDAPEELDALLERLRAYLSALPKGGA